MLLHLHAISSQVKCQSPFETWLQWGIALETFEYSLRNILSHFEKVGQLRQPDSPGNSI